MKYRVFHRTWWARANGKLEGRCGRKKKIADVGTAGVARDMCRVWNMNHDPGPLSDKAEFERVS